MFFIDGASPTTDSQNDEDELMDENVNASPDENINVDDVTEDKPAENNSSCFQSREERHDYTEEKEEGGPASAPTVVAH